METRGMSNNRILSNLLVSIARFVEPLERMYSSGPLEGLLAEFVWTTSLNDDDLEVIRNSIAISDVVSNIKEILRNLENNENASENEQTDELLNLIKTVLSRIHNLGSNT